MRPAVEDQGTQQQNTVAAEGGDEPGVGGTPAAAAPPEARATSLTRRFKGVAEGWWHNVKSVMTPRAQVPNTDPERTVEAKAEPRLGGTPAPAMPSSRTDPRSLLNPRFRTNLQALHGSRRKEDPSPLGTEASRARGDRPPTPPIGPDFGPRTAPAPTPMSERPMNLVAMAWYKTLKAMLDLTNLSEGCSDGSICARNLKAIGVQAQLSNLMFTTYALQQRDCVVGNSRLMEMFAAVVPHFLAGFLQ